MCSSGLLNLGEAAALASSSQPRPRKPHESFLSLLLSAPYDSVKSEVCALLLTGVQLTTGSDHQ